MPEKPHRPLLLCQLTVAVLLWSLTGLIIKTHPWDGLSLGFGRGAFAFVITLALLRKSVLRFRWIEVAIGAGFAVNATSFILASKWGPVANAIVLVYAAPIYSAIFTTIWKKERLAWYYWPALLAVVAGILLMVFDELGVLNLWATIAGLVSGLSLSVWIECRRYVDREGGDRGLFFGALITMSCLFPWFARECYRGIDLAPVNLLLVAIYALIIVIAYLLFSRVVQHIPGVTALLITGAEVPLMVFWVFLGTKELPPEKALLGGALIFFVTILISWRTAASLQPMPTPTSEN